MAQQRSNNNGRSVDPKRAAQRQAKAAAARGVNSLSSRPGPYKAAGEALTPQDETLVNGDSRQRELGYGANRDNETGLGNVAAKLSLARKNATADLAHFLFGGPPK